MKNLFHLLSGIYFLSMFSFSTSNAQVVITGSIGIDGSYTNLWGAFNTINAVSQAGANIVITINANTTEPVSGCILNNGAWASMSIVPGPGSISISRNITAGSPLIDFNGADNVTINGGSHNLTFSNTTVSSTAGTSTFRFRSDAANNRFTAINIYGSATMESTVDGGTIWFGENSTTTGNDNNIFEFCNIGSVMPSANLPSKCIYSKGTTSTPTLYNSGNIIRSCNIYNYFSNTQSAGIYLSAGTSSTTIFRNNFYMQSPKTGTGATEHSAIKISALGNGFSISENIIGYNTSNQTGVYSITGTGASLICDMISIDVQDTSVANVVEDNEVAGIKITASAGTRSFSGIYVVTGKVNILSNRIGLQNDTLNITASNSDLQMISVNGAGAVTCNNNSVEGVIINSTGSACRFYGINVQKTGALTCQNNNIGGGAANSINSLTTTVDSYCWGISINTAGSSNVTSNTIRNMTAAGSTNLTFGSLIGVVVQTAAANNTLSQNLIYNLKNTNVSNAANVTGIVSNSSTGNNLISRNFIHNNTVSNSNSFLRGILVLNGTSSYQNNMISLGLDESGNGINSGANIIGLHEVSGTNNFYFNTVYIGGSPTTGSNATYACSSNVVINIRNLRNNIFYNGRSNNGSTGKHYAICLTGSAPNPPGLTLNNNVYFANGTGGFLARYGSFPFDYSSLATWQAAIGQDANSFLSDPKLINPAGSSSTVDLHISPTLVTLVEGTGFNIGSITDDYDGQTRSIFTPVDIGADAGNFVFYVKVSNALVGNGNYLTLTAAITAINSGAQTSANILINIGASTTEPVTGSILNQGAWTSLIIQASFSGAVVSADVNAGLPLLDLNGADNVTIDGVSNGNNFTFSNTSTSSVAGTSTIRLRNDARNNKIKNCILEGSSTVPLTTEGGVLSFGTSPAGTTGNDNNVVSDCRIRSAGANLPAKGVSFLGTTTSAALNNSSDTIKNCDIEDYFSAAQSSAGIYIDSGNTDIGLSNNNFIQTAPRTQTIAAEHSAIKINNPNGNNFFVSGNKVGGASAYSITGVAGTKFYGIYIAGGTTGPTVLQNNIVQDNIIENISFSGTLTGTGVNSPFAGIYASAGLTNLYRNTIGNMSGVSSITLSSNSSSNADMLGIYMTGSGLVNECKYNNIGGITISNSNTGQTVFYCIRASSSLSTEADVQFNNIGGTVANSINNTTNGSSTRTFGIFTNGPQTLVSFNTIRNLTSAGGTGTANLASVIGILVNNSSSNVIYLNEVYDLKNTNTSAACVVNGIYISTSDTSYNRIESNFVHNLGISGNNSSINGIYANAGANSFENNMISIGLDPAGNSIVNGSSLNGFRDFGGLNNYYFNSVYIAGSPASGSNNTFAFNSSITSTTRIFRNNIFFNARSNNGSTGKHYSVRVGGTAPNPAGLTINNNIYLANGSGGVFGTFNGGDVTNLSAWQTAVGQDAFSYESNPQYINPAGSSSATNLHINPSFATDVEGNGFFTPHIVNDFDGQLRANLTPVDIGADAGNFTKFTKTLNLTMYIQGFYNSGTNVMVQDTVRVCLRNGSSPYAIVDSAKAYMSVAGTGSFTFTNISNGTPYYVQLKHRNSIETWSDNGETFAANTLSYDFTTASSKAYGNNMLSVDASPVRFGIYGGDVNQEGNVDLSDVLLVYNDASAFVTGYVKTDVNGDNITDLSDILITYNNSADFIVVKKP